MRRDSRKLSEQRYLKALTLRRQGKTLEQVGMMVGVKKERARQLVLLGQSVEMRRSKGKDRDRFRTPASLPPGDSGIVQAGGD